MWCQFQRYSIKHQKTVEKTILFSHLRPLSLKVASSLCDEGHEENEPRLLARAPADNDGQATVLAASGKGN